MIFKNLHPQELRLPEEQEALSSLLVSADFCDAVEKSRTENRRLAQRIHYELLTNGLILTAERSPQLNVLIETVKKRFALDCVIDVYVRRSDSHAASVIEITSDHYAIVLSHWLLSELNFDELTFVIGHELAHVAFGHFDSLKLATDKLPSRLKEKVHEQSRLAEMSADIAGAMCCEDVKSARKALYKLSCSGLTDLITLDSQSDHYQLDKVHELLEDQQTLFEAYSNHPASIVRLTILSATEDFSKTSCTEVDRKNFHAAIKTLATKSFPKTTEKEDWLTLIAAFWVGYADDDFVMAERVEVAKLCSGNEFKELSALCREEDDPVAFFERYFRDAVGCVNLTNPRRASLLQKVIHVSLADGAISEEEEEVIRKICSLIGLDQRFVDHLLSKYEEK